MVEDAYASTGFTAKVSPFIYDMAAAYACADLVVCRSGALTLAELTALGKPAVCSYRTRSPRTTTRR